MNRETKNIRVSVQAHKELQKRAKGKTITQVLDEILLKPPRVKEARPEL